MKLCKKVPISKLTAGRVCILLLGVVVGGAVVVVVIASGHVTAGENWADVDAL